MAAAAPMAMHPPEVRLERVRPGIIPFNLRTGKLGLVDTPDYDYDSYYYSRRTHKKRSSRSHDDRGTKSVPDGSRQMRTAVIVGG